ncbi:MAG: hypothetical protein WC980_03240 [Candidatus Brocadiia bacterium]
MTAEDNNKPKETPFYLEIFLAVMVIAFVLSLVFGLLHYQHDFWLVGLVAFGWSYLFAWAISESGALPMEFSTILLTWWIFWDKNPANAIYLYLPLVMAMFIAGYKKDSEEPRIITGLSFWLLLFVFWIYFIGGTAPDNLVQHSMLWSTVLMLLVHTVSIFAPKGKPLSRIDLILCSYSGNTAHYAEQFSAGARRAGAGVAVHRYHYYKDFRPELAGDALAVAFPVIGWKPPWPLLNYLLLGLPRGKGKPAYIMYSSAGGPENAGFLVWLILTLKGYKVAGRSWATYPINVATFRLGLGRLWSALDRLVPRPREAPAQEQYGFDFAKGNSAGLPIIFWPSPLFIIGIIIDNKLIDSLIYRNHVYKKRCSQCGICVEFCPAQRLTMVNGYPKSSGACVLCTCCVNLCPERAMNIWFFTEYGNPYHPRWRELVVKNRKDL